MIIFDKIKAMAKNDAGERIESLRFSVPALRVGVLEYPAGQLQTNNAELDGKTVKLYYPPEAVGDEKFLKSLETAPVVVGGHDSTTNEQNKKIDGWAHNVSYDATKKAAMLDGVVKGAKEVAYIRGNLGSEGFGASAFVDIFNLKVENGVTPDGQEYNAIAGELRATHVALAPHVRDPENKIRVTNAVCINTEGVTMEVTNGTYEDEQKKRKIIRQAMIKDGFSEYDDFGRVSKEATEKWDKEFQRRMTAKNTINIDPVAFSAAVKNAVKNATFSKIQDAPKMGAYQPTSLDEKKKNVDFRLIDRSGGKYTIDWKNGRRETVSKAEFEKLIKTHSYVTDF